MYYYYNEFLAYISGSIHKRAWIALRTTLSLIALMDFLFIL